MHVRKPHQQGAAAGRQGMTILYGGDKDESARLEMLGCPRCAALGSGGGSRQVPGLAGAAMCSGSEASMEVGSACHHSRGAVSAVATNPALKTLSTSAALNFASRHALWIGRRNLKLQHAPGSSKHHTHESCNTRNSVTRLHARRSKRSKLFSTTRTVGNPSTGCKRASTGAQKDSARLRAG